MSTPIKPNTQKEMIDQMWWILVGSNGDGIVSQVKVIRTQTDQIVQIIPALAKKEEVSEAIEAHECRDIELERAQREENDKKSMTLREWLSVLGTLGSFLWPIIVASWVLAGGGK